MEVPPAPVPVMETADLADFYVPEAVKLFLPHFRRMVLEKNTPEILNIYENEFNKISDRYFAEFPWPDAERISPLVDKDHTFLVLYKELQFRQIYAKHKPTIDHRFDSYYNYCELFNLILSEF